MARLAQIDEGCVSSLFGRTLTEAASAEEVTFCGLTAAKEEMRKSMAFHSPDKTGLENHNKYSCLLFCSQAAAKTQL